MNRNLEVLLTVEQKWEYCTVTEECWERWEKSDPPQFPRPTITSYTSNGMQIQELEGRDLPDLKNRFAKLISKLGSEGWELVGTSPGTLQDFRWNRTILWFRRPIYS